MREAEQVMLKEAELLQEATPSAAPAGPETKTCPMCAEDVKAAAVLCRFCGHRFDQP